MTRIQLQIHDSANEMNPMTGLPEMSVLNEYFDIEWVSENPDYVFTILRDDNRLLYGLNDNFTSHRFGTSAIIDTLINHFLNHDIDEKFGYVYWSDDNWNSGGLPLYWDVEELSNPLARCRYSEFKSKCEDWS